MNLEKEIKWFIVYEELAKKLIEYYKKHTKLSSVFLYNRLKDDNEFINNNEWFKKFLGDDSPSGLDPIHLFSSINGNSLRLESRINRIRILLNIFESNFYFEIIDFKGCPAPPVIKQTSIRSLGMQEQIWNFFALIHYNGNSILKIEDFELYKGWYGVEFASLTTFLFWVRSDSFVPLDKNTRQYLQITNFLTHSFNIQDYFSLIRKIDKYNYDSEVWGSKAIYREIAYVSYILINSKTEVKISKGLQGFFGLKDEFSEPNLSTGFKLIALKILPNCEEDHLNVLRNNEEKIFYFEKAFKIKENTIEFDSSQNVNLYQIKSSSNLNVNITAVVGKNGSGKSSLIELLAKTINNITFPFKKELRTEDLNFVKGLAIELYYKIGGKIFCIKVLGTTITSIEYNEVNENKTENDIYVFRRQQVSRGFSKEDLNTFFYSINVNYSHYSLNSNELGKWIEKLFHKNDSYQAPIVFNPMRTKGNIDINIENELTKSRLIANLIEPVEENDLGLRQLTNTQEAQKIEFEFNEGKNEFFFSDLGNQTGIQTKELYPKIQVYLDVVFRIFEINNKVNNKLVYETEKYIFRKLVKIWEKYPHYKDRFQLGSPRKLNIDKKEWILFIKRIQKDPSHIGYKVKQAINYLKYYSLIPKEMNFTLELDDLSIKIQRLSTKYPELEKIELIELLPPPIFKTNIIIIDKSKVPSNFNKLSSGEKQQIHSINSIIYHLKNLNSIDPLDTGLVKYRNINLILDEIELYYHPELQRKYISFLLKSLEKVPLDNIDSINICLITHSPYILSDIPHFYTLRLNNGIPDKDIAKTFGANIHELLTDSFFLDNSFIGEFAHKFITDLIEEINNIENNISDDEYDDYLKRINIIDEPFFKYKLIERLESKRSKDENTNLDELIKLKEKELEELKKKRKK
ncbi:hypothetical protein [uncultured Tenacibaculum sp.]|uniref:hypothetical protein n=1 Tax=uncultured Tenacibaculum sp. TaxID=174713 RepID=UPI002605546D|nr:hypothetical protein [uncultured Tenacibaculum sp.]